MRADDDFMKLLKLFTESHRFRLGTDGVQLWGGERKPEPSGSANNRLQNRAFSARGRGGSGGNNNNNGGQGRMSGSGPRGQLAINYEVRGTPATAMPGRAGGGGRPVNAAAGAPSATATSASAAVPAAAPASMIDRQEENVRDGTTRGQPSPNLGGNGAAALP